MTSSSSTRPMSWLYNVILLVIVGGGAIYWFKLPFWLMLVGPVLAGLADRTTFVRDQLDVRWQSFFFYGGVALVATALCWFSNTSGGDAFAIWFLVFILATVYDLLFWKPRPRTIQPPSPRHH